MSELTNNFPVDRSYVEEFRQSNGRNPRVLHIGNIANNAYNNAKILNLHGIDSDVICYDYYHVMGCPEWEDANFKNANVDSFNPDWSKIDLNGFRRPRWFAQGPLTLCISYLIAVRTGKHKLAEQRWQQLCHFNKSATFQDGNYFFLNLSLKWRLQATRIKRLFLHPAPLGVVWAKLATVAEKYPFFGFHGAALSAPLIIIPIFLVKFLLSPIFWRWNVNASAKKSSVDEFEERASQLIKSFNDVFPNRADQLTFADVKQYESVIVLWAQLFEYYDVIQAYSTDVVYPLLASKAPFFAYEHGTLREIPFQNNGVARLTALAYRTANGVFVTNTDNIFAAEKLGIRKERTYCLPHAFDYKKLHSYAGARLHNRVRNKVFTFFSPCRQHWVDNDPGWAKGNDRLIRAISILASNGLEFRVEFVEWGSDLLASKKLVSELGLEQFVHWSPQLQKTALWEKYLNADAVVDQFVISVISGVTFEALALGCPVITADDGICNRKFFGEAPPVVGAWTCNDVAHAMTSLIVDESTRQILSRKSISWIEKFHSPANVLAIQNSAYARNLN